MIHIFLGFPGDGKTTSLLNFCHHDAVNKESKLIIYDDSFLVGQSEQINETCSLTGVEHIAQENIIPDFILSKNEEGRNIYIDTSSVVPIFHTLEEVKTIQPINKIFVIDAMRFFYFSDIDKLELEKYDTIIVTKIDLLIVTDELKTIINKIPKTFPIYMSNGRSPKEFKKISNK